MEFRDDVEARAFGNQVIRDLIGTRAEHYYGWTLDIAEGERALPAFPSCPPTEVTYACGGGLRIAFNSCSHKVSGLRSPDFASSIILVAMACLTPSSLSPIRRAMQTISKATPRTRLSSGSNRAPLRNGVIVMVRSYWQAGAPPNSQPPTPGADCRCR